jgi:hypothetical protein
LAADRLRKVDIPAIEEELRDAEAKHGAAAAKAEQVRAFSLVYSHLTLTDADTRFKGV